jgi:hypothetical protein
MTLTPRRSTICLLLALSVACRLTPYLLARFGVETHPDATLYPWNLSPLLPIALFGGAVYADRRLAFAVPLVIYFLGDLGIWMVTGRADWAFYAYQPIVYLALALVAATGWIARARPTWPRVAAAGLVSSTLFFLVTNFAVWALGGGERYPLTASGLVACYAAALPYFRNTLLSAALFLPILFSRLSLVPRADAALTLRAT